jgi:hypothetical protein
MGTKENDLQNRLKNLLKESIKRCSNENTFKEAFVEHVFDEVVAIAFREDPEFFLGTRFETQPLQVTCCLYMLLIAVESASSRKLKIDFRILMQGFVDELMTDWLGSQGPPDRFVIRKYQAMTTREGDEKWLS